MSKLFLFIASIFLNVVGMAQVDWSMAKDWKLYRLNNQEALNYSPDTLANFKSIDLDSDKMKVWLKQATLWPMERKGLFMGLMVGSYNTENEKVNKIIFSPSGGFFYDDTSKRYYQIPPEFITQWNQYLNKQLDRVFSEYKF